MRKTFKLLVCLMMILTSVTLARPSVYAQEEFAVYVDAQNGRDTHLGTIDQPVQTLARAQELVREKTSGMSEDLKVYLRGGTYVLDAPITFTSADSGQNGYRVIWGAYKDENVIISGGTTLNGWTKVEGEDHIWKTSANGLESRDLYVNGERATLARSDSDALEWAKKYLYVNAENLPAEFARPQDLEIVFMQKWKWAVLRVASVQENSDFDVPALRLKYSDATKESFTTNLSGAALDDTQKADGMRYLQNAYELLDEPGEFYLNTEEDMIYYIPKEGEDMSSADAVLGRLENLLVFDGTANDPVKNITLSNLNFQYTTWLKANQPDGLHVFQGSALINPEDVWDREWMDPNGSAIYGEYADSIEVTNNRFEVLGGTGIHLGRGTKNSAITRNEFEKLGSGGIILGDVSSADHFPSAEALTQFNVISDNYINDVSNTYRGSTGILVGYTSDTKVEYNKVTNLPYTGISVGWGWGYGEKTMPSEGHTDEFVLGDFAFGNNSISYNYVEHVLTEPYLIDGGGIYTLGRQDGDNGSVIIGNYVNGVHNEYGGIYLDEGSVGFEITDNVLTNCVRNWLYKGDYNYIYDNYATAAQQPDRDERLTIGDVSQYRFENNDIWDETAVARIKEAAGIRAVQKPEDPNPEQPTPDQPGVDEPGDDVVYSIVDEPSNVSVIGKFPSDTKLVVDVLQDASWKEVLEMIKDRTFLEKYNFEKIFDIYLLKEDMVYQPEDSFVIRIKLDASIKDKNPKIVYISDEGVITEIPSEVNNGYISFHTDHNSLYAIVSEKTETKKHPIANTATQPKGSSQIAIILTGGLVLYLAKKRNDIERMYS